MKAARERESFLLEMPDNRASRTLASEDIEEGRQCLLHLPVRIEDHAIVVVIDQSGGQAGLQLAAACLALDPALQTHAEHMQLSLAHCSLQPQQQPVVEMTRVVQAVLIEDQGSRQGADLQQAMPVAGVAGQACDLQAEHDPHASHAHLRDQLLKAFPVPRRRGRLRLVLVDSDYALGGPAQLDGPRAEGVLALRAFCVFDDLVQRGLPHIEVRVSLQVFAVDFLTVIHGQASCRVSKIIWAKI